MIWRTSWLAGFVLAGLSGACQPLPHPFADDRPPAALLAVPNSIDVAIGTIEGTPRVTAANVGTAMASELLKRDIPASDRSTGHASYRLDGRIEESLVHQGKAAVTVFWQLRNAAGGLVSERSDRIEAKAGEWEDGDSESIVQLVTPGAAQFASLLTDAAPAEHEAPSTNLRLAIRRVAGAPGDGDEALTRALTTVLKRRDLDIVEAENGKPDLALDGEITVDPAKADKQHVKIVWHVVRPGGGDIGNVAQENDVPRGQLDGPWGDIAFSVAIAAESGIMELVSRGAPAPKTRAGAPRAAENEPPAPARASSPISTQALPPAAGTAESTPSTVPPPASVDAPPTETPPPPPPPSDIPAPILFRGVPLFPR